MFKALAKMALAALTVGTVAVLTGSVLGVVVAVAVVGAVLAAAE